MASPNTSLAEVLRLQGLDAMRSTGAVTAAAAARNNSMIAARLNNEAVLKAMIDRAQGQMWVIKDFDKLRDTVVGSGKCPGIVQSHGGLPLVRFWFEGPKVRGTPAIPYGTAVATFVDGKYPNWEHGNHVAIYIDQDPVKGVLVFDQWTGQPAGYRWMKYKDEAGIVDRSNNGSALSIVLTRKAP
jgi:hypothetical protein